MHASRKNLILHNTIRQCSKQEKTPKQRGYNSHKQLSSHWSTTFFSTQQHTHSSQPLFTTCIQKARGPVLQTLQNSSAFTSLEHKALAEINKSNNSLIAIRSHCSLYQLRVPSSIPQTATPHIPGHSTVPELTLSQYTVLKGEIQRKSKSSCLTNTTRHKTVPAHVLFPLL